MILLSKEDIQLIAMFNEITHSVAIDVIPDDANERIIFIVKSGQMALGIGKSGSNVQRLSKLLGKRVELVEESTSVEDLIAKALFPSKITILKKDEEKKIIYIQAKDKEKLGYMIGTKGKTISKARMLAQRYYDFQNIIVT